VQTKAFWDHYGVIAEGGMLCLISLRQVILPLGGVPIPAMLPVFRVQESFDAEGNPQTPDFQKRAKEFFYELLWFTEGLAGHRADAT
jgi:NAD(P)H-dependent FMN reductase